MTTPYIQLHYVLNLNQLTFLSTSINHPHLQLQVSFPPLPRPCNILQIILPRRARTLHSHRLFDLIRLTFQSINIKLLHLHLQVLLPLYVIYCNLQKIRAQRPNTIHLHHPAHLLDHTQLTFRSINIHLLTHLLLAIAACSNKPTRPLHYQSDPHSNHKFRDKIADIIRTLQVDTPRRSLLQQFPHAQVPSQCYLRNQQDTPCSLHRHRDTALDIVSHTAQFPLYLLSSTSLLHHHYPIPLRALYHK